MEACWKKVFVLHSYYKKQTGKIILNLHRNFKLNNFKRSNNEKLELTCHHSQKSFHKQVMANDLKEMLKDFIKITIPNSRSIYGEYFKLCLKIILTIELFWMVALKKRLNFLAPWGFITPHISWLTCSLLVACRGEPHPGVWAALMSPVASPIVCKPGPEQIWVRRVFPERRPF